LSANKSARALFIADLHLDPERQAAYRLALNFFDSIAEAHQLYILGDLFEYWIGDDVGLHLYRDVVASLQTLVSRDCAVTVMLGNRDFLLGERFAEATGVRLVREDEHRVQVNNEPVLLLHGDTLCLDDVEYQSFRTMVRDQQWQAGFLAKSIDERTAYANELRQQSQSLSKHKAQAIMDVNEEQVQSRLQARQCQKMIHGHTHRPAVHRYEDTGTCRLVVGDWHDDHARYVCSDTTGLDLTRFTA